MRYSALAVALLTWTICTEQALADRIFYLSFDRLERTPVRVALQADESKSPGAIRLSDSAKLMRGLNGLGVYIQQGDFLVFLAAISMPRRQRLLLVSPNVGTRR